MKKKREISKQLKKIKEHYDRIEHLFLSADEGKEGGGGGMIEDKGKQLDYMYLISSLDENGRTRAVHMPGYPE